MKRSQEEMLRSLSSLGYNEDVKALLMTGPERAAYVLLKQGRVDTSTELSKSLDVSIFHASNILRKLYKKGYTLRSARVQSSGGIEHVYKARIIDPVTKTIKETNNNAVQDVNKE